MKCWCGENVKDSEHLDYFICTKCKTFISKELPAFNLYDFDNYWHTRQIEKFGHPTIEQRVKDDFKNRIPFWWNILKQYDIKSVLEIGCGHGGFLHQCKQNGIEKCLGIEISEGTCEFARKTFGLDILCYEFPNVEIKENFDVICGFDVFEHFIDPMKCLLKMKSLAKYIMIQIPCFKGEKISNAKYFVSGAHMFIFNNESIQSIFKKTKIEILSITEGAFKNDITIFAKT